MPYKLYYHPLSSFCQKVLIALYENDIPFDGEITDVVSPEGRAAFVRIWPIVKFPVLRDEATGRIVPESSIIIEYLQHHAPCKTALVPADSNLHRRIPDLPLRVRRQRTDLLQWIRNPCRQLRHLLLEEVDGLEPGLCERNALVSHLVAGQCAERLHVRDGALRVQFSHGVLPLLR